MTLSPLKILSIFVWLMLVAGYLSRRSKRRHISLMATAITIDLAMVVYLEVTRQVVESIPGRPMSPLLIFHVCLSVGVLVLYAVQVTSGIRKARGRSSSVHRRLGLVIVLARLGNLITSFYVS